MYLRQSTAGVGGGSNQIKGLMRPATSKNASTKLNKPQAMCTNLNEVIRTNPKNFYPSKVA